MDLYPGFPLREFFFPNSDLNIILSDNTRKRHSGSFPINSDNMWFHIL